MKEIRCLRVRKIWSDDRHNAFTSICGFKGNIYIAFRSAENHLSHDAAIRIICSNDGGTTWKSCAYIQQENCDLRDPRIIEFNGALHLFTFANRQNGKSSSLHITSCDGVNFSDPEEVQGMSWAWGIAEFNGKLYCADYYSPEKPKFFPRLFSSDDAKTWNKLLDFPFTGNETAIDFDDDGSLFAFIRDSVPGCIPRYFKLTSPYDKMPEGDGIFPIRIVGAMIKRLNNATLLIGRCWDGESAQAERRNRRTDVYLIEDGKAPQFCFTLPSGGDTSYASYYEVSKTRALISYYSSHEHLMAYPIEEKADKIAAMNTHADIYLAEFSHNCTKEQ